MLSWRPVAQTDRQRLWNLFQKYLYEMTNYYDHELDGEGNYRYGYFDRYFEEPDREALFLWDGDTLVGFAMLNRHSCLGETVDHALAEFTIFPMYRRQHLGLLLPYHILQDTYEEERLAGNAFGSTKSGIAPFYSDKYAKIGVQVCDLFDEPRLRQKLSHALDVKNVLFEHLYHKPALKVDDLMVQLLEARELLRPFVGDAVGFVHQALKDGKTILLEGQLGAMKDPDLGIFPMTTSSHTLAGFGCVGAAVPPTAMDEVICVTKAYSSCVGSQTEPFISEVTGQEGDELRRRGGDKGEFGATTGRPRRVGWFDTVATKYGCMVQGATNVALTCLDVLGYLDEIPVCVGYEIDGTVTDVFPTTPRLVKAKPVFETLPGWKCDIRGETDYAKLPKEARDYVDFLEAHIGRHIGIVSTGPRRGDIALRK